MLTTFLQMKKEIAGVYERVKILCLQLKQRSRDPLDSSRLENLPVSVQQVKVSSKMEFIRSEN